VLQEPLSNAEGFALLLKDAAKRNAEIVKVEVWKSGTGAYFLPFLVRVRFGHEGDLSGRQVADILSEYGHDRDRQRSRGH